MVHIYNGILLSYKQECIWISFTRVDKVEPIIQSKVNQKEKDNYHIVKHIKSRDITLPTKVRLFKAMGFSTGHIWMWELDYKESWAHKNCCFLSVVLEKTLESPLDCKEIQPVHPKWDQSWVFIGRTDVEAETPVIWPHDGKSWLIWKDPDAGKDWGQEEKGTTEDEMVG